MAIKKVIYYKDDGTVWELDEQGAKEYERQMLEASEFCATHGKVFKSLPWRDVKSRN